MRLHPRWKIILTRAWSMRAMVLAVLLSGVEVALQLVTADALGIPPGCFAAASAIVTMAAMVLRLLAQKGITDA